ncbi:hypothetical protein H5410_028048 [Solanum commersonii]|uniref:Uncharacterized protein n=1 Tax=Solanum commersonii TaxID=4109 RepID=A0A9J5Z545_SOLCO|nr:hypothetical protein H5410_028048 [Solanum commersonii]
MKRILMMSVGSKWREWKHEAKSSGYDSYTNDVERLTNHRDSVEEDQWRALVRYWSSTDAKKKSERNKEKMNDLVEVYPELNVPRSAPTGKGVAPSLVYDPLYKRSQNEQRDFDKRVEIEVQKVSSTLKIEMEEKLFEAKEEIEVMDKKLSKVEEDMEMVKKKLSKENMNMEEKIDDKVKAGILAYVDSLGITLGLNRNSFSNEQFLINLLKIANNHYGRFSC